MAENHIQPDKMAVNSIDQQSSKPTQNHNDIDETDDRDVGIKGNVNHSNAQDAIYLNTRKKSSFQITRVITKSKGSDHADGDVDDDLDETNTEEVSSDLLDISKTTDTDHDPPSEDTLSAHSIAATSEDFQKDNSLSHIPTTSSTPQVTYSQTVGNHVGFQQSTQPSVPVHNIQTLPTASIVAQSEAQNFASQSTCMLPDKSAARFKVVKIESKEPFRRGRWVCLDYLTPVSNERFEKTDKIEKGADEAGSGNSSAASSVHYVPGVDDPSRNPLQEGSIILQNGDFSSQSFNGSQSYSNGTHIMPNASMPSQHIPTQVPTTLTQTHMQNVLPQASLPESVSHQFSSGPSTSTSSGQTSHGQTAQSQSSFSQANVQPPISSQPVMQQSQQSISSDSEFIPQQTDFIPNTSTQKNAQQPQEMSSQSQTATSGQEYSSSTNGLQVQKSSTQPSSQPVDFVQQQPVPSSEPGSKTTTSNEPVHFPPANDNVKEFNNGQETGGGFGNSTNPESNAPATSESSEQKSEEFSSKLSAVQLLDFAIKTDDEGGASTVAIDNKIEQAMDLVKSHLMYAVREEVEVLREQIKELLEKNSQLEYENQILKQAASPETLAQLNTPRPHSLSQAPHGQGAPPATSSS